jgi:hypothetical protein
MGALLITLLITVPIILTGLFYPEWREKWRGVIK